MRVVIMKDGLPKRENFHLKNYFDEFMATEAKVARIDLDEGDYKSTKSAYQGFEKAAKRLGLPVKVRTIDGKIYLIRTDL